MSSPNCTSDDGSHDQVVESCYSEGVKGIEKSESETLKPSKVDSSASLERTTEIDENNANDTGASSADAKLEEPGHAKTDEAELSPETTNDNSLSDYKLQTIASYMSLASSKKNHFMLLQEATISGFLVLCLGDDDPRVVEESIDVFLALFQLPENKHTLLNLTYFAEGLRCVCRNSKVNTSVRHHAKKMLNELKEPKCAQPLAELSKSKQNVLATSTKINSNISAAPSVRAPLEGEGKDKIGQQKPDLNTTMSTMKRKNKGKETVLFVANEIIQQKSERTRITQALISVPGIISVTYDLKKNFCILRGKRNVPPEDFGRAVASLGVADVFIVRKNENKEEIKIQIKPSDKENTFYPQYPEEVENEDVDSSSAVATKDQLHAEDASFFKSAKNFIKRSFYW